jgi:pimeloyl-ACP methyl ester carboxylesterase
MFYGEFLDWLEQQLNHASISPHGLACETLQNHFENLVGQRPPGAQGNPPALTEEQVRHVTNFDFPVHAFGYNWLESNLDSGKHLVERINKIRDYYRAQGRKCDKVILATHSMGGLVARAACKVHGGEELVWGVVHGVMPTDGAAATYKRFVAGFGGEGGGIKGSAVSMILGATGPQATPVLAFAPGPMELLPNKQYNQGQPWFWIKDASGHVTLSLPETGDPYKEIYERQDVWWRMVNPEWLNPAGMDIDNPLEEHFFALGTAQAFHEVVHKAGNLHKTTFAHYGMDESRKAWSGVGWDAKRSGLTLANMRNVGNGRLEDALYKGHAIATVATVSHPDAAGDGTVPGLASGAGVDSGAQLVCRQTGYAHDGSYNDAGARQSVLDAILRIIAPIPEPT